MIEKLLPPSVAVAEWFGDPVHAPLLGAEPGIVAGAVGKRRREFATVRWCARRALADLGIAPSPSSPAKAVPPRGRTASPGA